jgi:hypothetical protein
MGNIIAHQEVKTPTLAIFTMTEGLTPVLGVALHKRCTGKVYSI